MNILSNSALECEIIAGVVDLQYINDSIPGIYRKRRGKKFVYYYPDGHLVEEHAVLERIKSLAIPPAYRDVWISPFADGHLQATGRDSKNRKQYRYHPLWRRVRANNKFKTMVPFGEAICLIRNNIQQELDKPLKINKNQIICAIIYLLDNHLIRIGNAVYEKQNNSYGVTTLRKKHLSVNSNKAVLKFKGKNSKAWHIVLKDKKIVRILKKCEEIPGYKLFKYRDENNAWNVISSQDVNSYLFDLTNYHFTAKDFRTWGACRETFYRLTQCDYIDEKTSGESLKDIIASVASLLGHTPAICQKSYIYPEIINHWKEKKINAWIKKQPDSLITDKDKLLFHWLKSHIKD